MKFISITNQYDDVRFPFVREVWGDEFTEPHVCMFGLLCMNQSMMLEVPVSRTYFDARDGFEKSYWTDVHFVLRNGNVLRDSVKQTYICSGFDVEGNFQESRTRNGNSILQVVAEMDFDTYTQISHILLWRHMTKLHKLEIYEVDFIGYISCGLKASKLEIQNGKTLNLRFNDKNTVAGAFCIDRDIINTN